MYQPLRREYGQMSLDGHEAPIIWEGPVSFGILKKQAKVWGNVFCTMKLGVKTAVKYKQLKLKMELRQKQNSLRSKAPEPVKRQSRLEWSSALTTEALKASRHLWYNSGFQIHNSSSGCQGYTTIKEAERLAQPRG